MTMMDELRGAFRSCRRAPGFAIAAILLIALGVGANTAVFSIVRAVLLRPLPYNDPDRLVFVWRERMDRPVTHARHGILAGEEVRALSAESRSVSDLAVVRSWQGNPEAWIDVIGDPAPERLRGMYAKRISLRCSVSRLRSDGRLPPPTRSSRLRSSAMGCGDAGLAPIPRLSAGSFRSLWAAPIARPGRAPSSVFFHRDCGSPTLTKPKCGSS